MKESTSYALRHDDLPSIVYSFAHGSWWCAQSGDVLELDVIEARESWKAAVAQGYRRDRELEADIQAEREECAAGFCDHYTCTEGRSLDEWIEPEPTRWDYVSEAYGPTAGDAPYSDQEAYDHENPPLADDVMRFER